MQFAYCALFSASAMLRQWTLKLVTALAFLALVGADNPQVVNLGFATYQGTLSSATNISSFFGLRYASPPVGASLVTPLLPSPTNVSYRKTALPTAKATSYCQRRAAGK